MVAGRLVITKMRSDNNTASRMEWVMNSAVRACCCCQRSSSSTFIWSRVMASSALNGSSINRMPGSLTSARQIDTRWRMPPESWCGRCCSKACRPTERSRVIARWRTGSIGMRAMRAGNSTFSSTVFQGSRVGSWNMMPTSSRGPVIGCSATISRPSLMSSRPAQIIKSVLLPQPLGPRIETNSPFSMRKLTLCSASTALPSGS